MYKYADSVKPGDCVSINCHFEVVEKVESTQYNTVLIYYCDGRHEINKRDKIKSI